MARGYCGTGRRGRYWSARRSAALWRGTTRPGTRSWSGSRGCVSDGTTCPCACVCTCVRAGVHARERAPPQCVVTRARAGLPVWAPGLLIPAALSSPLCPPCSHARIGDRYSQAAAADDDDNDEKEEAEREEGVHEAALWRSYGRDRPTRLVAAATAAAASL
jgi:hypothetical protein